MKTGTNRESLRDRVAVAVGVGVGLLAGACLCYLWLIFGGAAAGNSGASSDYENTFKPISLAVFGAYVLVTFALYYARLAVPALLVAWLPVILVFFVLPNLGTVARFFGVK